MNVSNVANTIQRWRRRSSSACPASDIKSQRVFVPKAAARRRTSTAKKKVTSPRSVPPPQRMRLRLKAKPTPKPRGFTPQLLALLTSRNSIRFCAASMSCAPLLKGHHGGPLHQQRSGPNAEIDGRGGGSGDSAALIGVQSVIAELE